MSEKWRDDWAGEHRGIIRECAGPNPDGQYIEAATAFYVNQLEADKAAAEELLRSQESNADRHAVTLTRRIEALAADKAALLEALKKAEWTEHGERLAEDLHCGVCYGRKRHDGHLPDCVVGQTLSRFRSEGAEVNLEVKSE